MSIDSKLGNANFVNGHFQIQNWYYRYDSEKCKEGKFHKVFFFSNEIFKNVKDPGNPDPLIAHIGRFDPLSEDELKELPEKYDFRNRVLRITKPTLNPQNKVKNLLDDKFAYETFIKYKIPTPQCYWKSDEIDPLNSKNTNFWIYEKMDFEASVNGWSKDGTRTYESLSSLDQSLLIFVKDVLKSMYLQNLMIEDFYPYNVMYNEEKQRWAIVDMQTIKRNKQIEKIARVLLPTTMGRIEKQKKTDEKMMEIIRFGLDDYLDEIQKTELKTKIQKQIMTYVRYWSAENLHINHWLIAQTFGKEPLDDTSTDNLINNENALLSFPGKRKFVEQLLDSKKKKRIIKNFSLSLTNKKGPLQK